MSQSTLSLKLLLLIFTYTLLQGAVPSFKARQRVAFMGDSISHAGHFHADIYLFYATRFPSNPFQVYNRGIAGDSAGRLILRLDEDIKSTQATIAVVMLGMNDAYNDIFSDGKSLSEKLSGKSIALKNYTKSMEKIVFELKQKGTEVILIKPSIYDQTAQIEKTNLYGKNDLLGKFSNYIDVLATNNKAYVVDFHTPMTVLNHSIQVHDPKSTLIGKDRVHPGLPGHLVMAYYFLKAQNMPQYVSAIHLDAKDGGRILHLINCEIPAGLVNRDNSLSFTATEATLPFPVGSGQSKALEWVPFQHELNRQVLAVVNLAEGLYTLFIDGVQVGQYRSSDLKNGIELSSNQVTPQYQQALQVKAAHKKQLSATGKLRTLAMVRHSILRKTPISIDESDTEKVATALLNYLESIKQQPWYNYFKQQVDIYLENIAHKEAYRKEEAHWMREIWRINQPKPHEWRLEKVD